MHLTGLPEPRLQRLESDSADPEPGRGSRVPSRSAEAVAQGSKKAARRKHRWRRRILYGMAFIVFLAAAGAGGLYFYARYRYDEIPKIHSKHLVKQTTKPGEPFNVLLVGSDSRAFVNNPTQVKAFGDEADAGGQRSDVTMVARFVPATKSVTVISIPRDLWVDIPQNSSDISGMNRINAAYNSGPDLLIQTIESVLHIPINHYISVGFDGFSGMVNALGGVTMDFPTAVKDAYTGLDVTTTGCQIVNGTVALQLVRSRHLQYVNKNGYWEYDGLSDFSRIQRQDSFFRAVLAKVNTSITNPLAINGFISAAVGNLAIDDTLTEGDLLHIATEFHGLSSSHLITETLPTTSYVTDGGADVLLAAQPYASQMIAAFNQLGVPKPKPSTTTTTTAPPLANSAVSVDVLNASGGGLLATDTAAGLRRERVRDHRHQQRTEPDPGRGPLGDLLRPLRAPRRPHVGGLPQGQGDLRARFQPGREQRDPVGGQRLPDRHADQHHDDHGPHDDLPATSTPTRSRRPGTRCPAPWGEPRPPPPLRPRPRRPRQRRPGPRRPQADLRLCRTMRRRSRSVVPPHTPSRSRWARACSRQA